MHEMTRTSTELVADTPGRLRLRQRRAAIYEPRALALELFGHLDKMERESDKPPACDRYRRRTGLVCAPEFRRAKGNGRVEDAITEWLATRLPNASSQVRDFAAGQRPDILLGYERDPTGVDIAVAVEAKPVWQTWITTGERVYSKVTTDEVGRSTGPYLRKNVRQLVADRDKLLRAYTDRRDRHLLLALVFQRAGEVDRQVIEAIGGSWDHALHHVPDLCNPPGDSIGTTAIVFWPNIPIISPCRPGGASE